MNTLLEECAHRPTPCSCTLKDFLYQQLKELHEMQAVEDMAQSDWFKTLLETNPLPPDSTPCCLLIYLCYYAYFEESFLSVSEHSRKLLSTLISSK